MSVIEESICEIWCVDIGNEVVEMERISGLKMDEEYVVVI